MHFTQLVHAILTSLLLATPASAQALRVRLSVKLVLDKDGNRPAAGHLNQEAQVEEYIAYANQVLRAMGADWRLVITEFVDVPGISQWYGPWTYEQAFSTRNALEQAAESQPEAYFWRRDAVNVYLIDLGETAVCSFPPGADVILISTSLFQDTAGWLEFCGCDMIPEQNIPFHLGDIFLHEIGHYVNLCHTHGCNYDDLPCNLAPVDDGVADTLPDHSCWRTADEFAVNDFGRPWAELTPVEQNQVDVALHNVMSYHGCSLLGDRRAFLTEGQLARAALELDPDTGRRKMAVYTTCEAGTVAGEEESDCDANGLLDECEADCNLNGLPDACDLASGTSRDCDLNAVPDECDVLPQGFGFADRAALKGGLRARHVVTGDLDSDGHLDVATANLGENTFSVHFGIGDATFAPATSVDLGYRPGRLAIGDLDADGDLDVVSTDPGTLSQPGTRVSVFWNAGSRTFTDPLVLEGGGGPYGLTAADLDSDGALDLAAAASSSNEVVILWSTGGAFVGASFPVDGGPRSVDAVDLDSDGDRDLVTSEPGAGTLSVLRNDGRRAFGPRRAFDVGIQPFLLVLADLNADGRPDACVGAASALEVRVLLGDGAGSFGEQAEYGFQRGPATGNLTDLLPAELNSDGRTDLVLTSAARGAFSVLLQRPGGGFAAGQLFRSPSAAAAAAGDLDGDLFLDLVVSQSSTRDLWVHRNLSMPAPSPDCNGNSAPDACDLASGVSQDLDLNGRPDECPPPRPRFHRGDPNSSGEIDVSDGVAVFAYLFTGGAPPSCMEAADAQSDGAVDISDGIAILSYLFTGGRAPPSPGPPGAPCGPDPDEPGSAGDLGCIAYLDC